MSVTVIVQARMGSKRFPGKVMADLNGKPMIGHLIGWLRKVRYAENVVYAIPEKDQNGPLGKYLLDQNVHVVTGPEDDVAERFRLTLEAFPCDRFVRICADSPLAIPEMIDDLIIQTEDFQGFTQMTCMPGTTAQVCDTQCFLECLPDFTPEEREHVLIHFVREGSLLVDTPEDLRRVQSHQIVPLNMGFYDA